MGSLLDSIESFGPQWLGEGNGILRIAESCREWTLGQSEGTCGSAEVLSTHMEIRGQLKSSLHHLGSRN